MFRAGYPAVQSGEEARPPVGDFQVNRLYT
jgi:hypothetical protein